MKKTDCACGENHGGWVPISGPDLSRRRFFRVVGTGVTGYYLAQVTRPLEVLAQTKPPLLNTGLNCIFIFLAGAPSHIDTFDLKEGSWTPTNFAPTTVSGIRLPAGIFPQISDQMSRIAILRSVQAKALVHQLAQVWAQIGRSPTGALGDVSPNIGSVVALEMDSKRKPTDVLPGFVGLNSDGIAGPGYFSARYAPFPVIPNQRGLAHLSHPEGTPRFETRWNYLMDIDGSLRENSPYGKEANDMGDYYESGRLLMYDQAVINAFKFTTEEQTRFGNSSFGDACVTARNLLKTNKGTRFITVTLGGWDHHNNIYDDTAGMYPLCANLDAGLANLLKDLAATTSPERAGKTLLDDTLIVVMGEFGRTVGALNEAGGRDHFLRQFALFAGGGVKGGRALGQTDAAGSSIVSYGWAGDRDVRNEDISATLYSALGIDYTTVRYDDPLGRGFEYVPQARDGVYMPVDDLFK